MVRIGSGAVRHGVTRHDTVMMRWRRLLVCKPQPRPTSFPESPSFSLRPPSPRACESITRRGGEEGVEGTGSKRRPGDPWVLSPSEPDRELASWSLRLDVWPVGFGSGEQRPGHTAFRRSPLPSQISPGMDRAFSDSRRSLLRLSPLPGNVFCSCGLTISARPVARHRSQRSPGREQPRVMPLVSALQL